MNPAWVTILIYTQKLTQEFTQYHVSIWIIPHMYLLTRQHISVTNSYKVFAIITYIHRGFMLAYYNAQYSYCTVSFIILHDQVHFTGIADSQLKTQYYF